MARKGQIVIFMLCLLLVMTACGATANHNESAQESSNQTNAEQQEDKETSSGEDAVESETRVIEGEFGEAELPANPKRIVALYLEDYLKALEVDPIVQWYNPTWGKQDYLALDLPLFDNTSSLEALMAQEPDLIIADGATDQEKYDQLSKIAPTYRIPEEALQSSEEILKSIANALGIPEKAESVLQDYQNKIDETKALLEQAVGKETVAVIRINTGDKTIALFGVKNRFIGELYSKYGLEPHPLVKEMEAYQEILSEEGFASLDADHIIVLVSNGDWDSPENAEAIKLLDSPIWKTVPAFANNHVYKVDRSHWQTGAIMANLMKLDDLQKMFVK